MTTVTQRIKKNQYKEDSVYIPEFICGICAAILAEVAAFVIWAVCDERKKRKK